MKNWTTEQEAAALEERFSNVNQAEFARANGMPGGASMISQHIKGRRPINLEQAMVYARGFGVPLSEISPRLAQLAHGAAALDVAAQSPEGAPSNGGTHNKSPLAQIVSQVTPTIDPITISWESIVSVSSQLPPLFKLALADDALAPDYPTGSLFVWSTTKRPRIGSIVLVLDSFNQPHARRHAQGRAPGQWVAEATGAGFLPFDGADVTLLAVADEERRQMP